MDLKHVVVVDDDIDVNNPTDVEWAIATRVQGDKDVIIIPGARAKPLDPSLLQGAGVVPIGAKVGIDATIPERHSEGALRAHHLRLCRHREGRRLRQGQEGRGRQAGDEREVAALAEKILAAIDKEPLYYTDIAERFSDYDFNTVARALGHLHETEKLWQDPRGRMCVRGSKFAAVLPVKK